MTKLVQVHPEMVVNAASRSVAMGGIKHSFTNGDRNIVGFIGEEIFRANFPTAIHHDVYDYDFLINEKKVDVKTRICRADPRPDFDFTIKQTRSDQCVDVYVFIGLHESLRHGWLFGWLKKSQFFSMAEKIDQNEKMPQGGSYLAGGLRVYIDQMEKFK